MKASISTCLLVFIKIVANSQELYTKALGDTKDNALIFLHGGPGYNCANFEATTAQLLADKGFFEIVYDRRGEGRSLDNNAAFTFNQTFEDLTSIYKQYDLSNATLLAHSFGGLVATLFAKFNPKKVKSIVLIGALISLQKTFANIIFRVKKIYQTKSDSTNLKYITMLENMDTKSLEFSFYCFSHAMMNGFYSPQNPSAEAKIIYSTFITDKPLNKYGSKMTRQAPRGFWKNEKYITIDLENNVQNLQKLKIKIYGLYGQEDGLYSIDQVKELQHLLGKGHVFNLDTCSYNVIVDQQ